MSDEISVFDELKYQKWQRFVGQEVYLVFEIHPQDRQRRHGRCLGISRTSVTIESKNTSGPLVYPLTRVISMEGQYIEEVPF